MIVSYAWSQDTIDLRLPTPLMAHVLSYAMPRVDGVKLFAATVIEHSMQLVSWPWRYLEMYDRRHYLVRGPIRDVIMEVCRIPDGEGLEDEWLGRCIPAEWCEFVYPKKADLESLQPVKYDVLAHAPDGSFYVEVVLQLKTWEMLDAERRQEAERAKTAPTKKKTERPGVVPWDELPFYGTEYPGQPLFTPEGPTFFLCPVKGTRSVKEVVVFKDDVYGNVVVMSCSRRPLSVTVPRGREEVPSPPASPNTIIIPRFFKRR